MKEELVSFKTAKLAKEKRFDWKVVSHYKDDELINSGALYNWNCPEEQEMWNIELTSAPTKSLLQKYLREKHNIFVIVELDETSYPKFCFRLVEYNEKYGEYYNLIHPRRWSDLYRAYEEALEVGLQEALKIIK